MENHYKKKVVTPRNIALEPFDFVSNNLSYS